MSRNEINDIINQRKSSLSRLNKLFYTIDLFKGTNQNEYLRLSEKVLVQLEKGVDYNKMKEVLEYELVVGYGLFHSEFDSENIAKDILDLWEHN
ncbi:hypothetical protein IX39_17725 [Chryseobacterium formosense]|uniref:Uncharacterized protein n=1 Tax=Chryseobacterium formosense TaxID=236814 RepID=A0A085Z1B4_9FLAO|nr:hypothetical protein [Chryseobacterium formosense]KFE98227.1 hypothetical protein IX39_17725 [Chryseobacterium formosense]SFT74517.1 hypothetical protein SAMN05421857_2950 [Chryseobacterium formosense]